MSSSKSRGHESESGATEESQEVPQNVDNCGVSNNQEAEADSEKNFIAELTDVKRETAINNDGCQFTLIDYEGLMKITSSCEGTQAGRVDIIGNYDSVPWTFLMKKKLKKHHTRTKYYKVDFPSMWTNDSFASQTTATTDNPVPSSRSLEKSIDSGLSEPQPPDQTQDEVHDDDVEEKPSEPDETPATSSGLGRFGLMKKLTQGKSDES